MFYLKESDDVLKNVQSSVNGLSQEVVEERLKRDGFNELSATSKFSIWHVVLETLKDPLLVILFIAAVVQVFLGEVVESAIIMIVIVLNTTLSVVQTKKAESSIQSLKKLSSPHAKVIRNGVQTAVTSPDIVVGDIVLLEAGDVIPGDGRILEAQSLKVVEGMLTGESEPVLKHAEKLNDEVMIGDQKNMVFSGALVVYGRGKYVVTATGMNTEVGKIANLLEGAGQKQTPLQQKLEAFSKKLGIGILMLAVCIFALQVTRAFVFGTENMTDVLLDSFMFAIAVAVAAIPEALSSIVTIVLAVGTNKLAKKQAIVRKLPAVETLGCTSVICTDKTGTLTQNKMKVVDVFMYGVDNEELNHDRINFSYHAKTLTLVSTLCNDSVITEDGKEIGDPTEVALIQYSNVRQLSYEEIRTKYNRVGEIPFDSDRKLMSTVNDIYGNAMMFTKGAPDIIFSRCKYAFNNGVIVPLEGDILEAYKQKNEAFSNRALRVLAFAIKDVPDVDFVPAIDDEVDMILVGMMAMIDPPREEVKEAIKTARVAGIKTVMMTGDHLTTAKAIGADIGLLDHTDLAMTGAQLEALTDEELDEVLPKVSVYARVTPEHKIRVVKAWQKREAVTAMTGDGVNDAPALKQADIGIGMGSGTEVAKDAGDLILVDDNFVSIVNAIEIGRSVYSNIKKSITYLFAGNLGAIVAILVALFANWANPFTAIQLLFINLINDSLPAIALGLEPAEKNVMKQKPRSSDESIFDPLTLRVVLVRGVLIGLFVVAAQYIGMQHSKELGTAMAFSTLIMARIIQTLPARSNESSVFELGLFSNKYVIGAVVICFTLFSLTLLPGVRTIFAIPEAFGFSAFGISFGLALLSGAMMEIGKKVVQK